MNALRGCARYASLGSLLLAAGSCHGAPVLLPGMFGTGFGGDGVLLDGGGIDAHYGVRLVNTQAQVLHEPGAGWLANSETSRWVWQTAQGAPSGVMRIFRKSFELGEDIDLSMLTISGSWATAGMGLDIEINGISTGQTASGAAAWSSFVINDGFVTGTNTIDFFVQSTGSVGGFRVDGISGVVNLPGPGAMLVLVAGGAMLTGRRRRG